MLMNLQSRREGVQNDKMISVVPQYAYLKCVHQNCDRCSSHKLSCEHSVKGYSTYFTTSTCDFIASGSFRFLVSPKFVPT